jgi:hypothetical protein
MSQPKVNQPGSLDATTSPVGGETVDEGSVEDRLTKLKTLYDKGLITLDQYEYKQRKILEGL